MLERHILLIIPNLGRGGAQQVFRDQLQFYSQYHKTIGCVFNWDDSFPDDQSGSIISMDIPAGKNWISKIFCFAKRVMALRKIKKNYKIDISISHLEGADYVNLLSKGTERIICWIHGTKSFDHNIEGVLGDLRKKILIPFTYKRCDLVVTVSEGIRQELIGSFSIPSTKIKTIYNGFNLSEITGKAAQPVGERFADLFKFDELLITHCRLSRQKNLFALLDIFKEVKNRSSAKLVILGDGELKEELVQYSHKNGLNVFSVWDANRKFDTDCDVFFLGYERNPYPFLNRASLYLMTSLWEGFPLSLCEAMACGLPVLTADCYTGPREIVAPELSVPQPITNSMASLYGVLMPLPDVIEQKQAWTEEILSILSDVSLRNKLSIAGKERVKAFDKNLISAKWLEILR